MARVIAIGNNKGGIGKTTTAANLATGLVRRGRRVLAIDNDPQGHLSKCLGVDKPANLLYTLNNVMYNLVHDIDVEPADGLIKTAEGVDLMPTNLRYSGMELDLFSAMNREQILKEYVTMMRPFYDYIIIDCQPTLGLLTVNAFTSADSLLHDKDNVRVEGIEEGEKKSRSTKEVEAESVAYTVCQHFGIDTSEYSFAYVAGWSSGKEMPELKESMDTIRKTASQLITGIENELREIQLQRSQTMEKAQEPVTLVVAECCEYHALGEHYEGVKSVDEAIRLFEAIPSERLNGIKSIGLDVPRVDKEFSMEIDVLVGQTFDLDTLNFVPGVKENKQAMEMIARLIDHYPEMEIRGEIPPLCAEILSQIREERTLLEELPSSMALAIKIDEFMHDFDPYAYADQVTDREAQVKTISDDLEKGEAGYMVSYFKELISNEDGLMEDRQKAQQFIKEIEEYKPLAKIEEQLEENYNHIDNYLNNLKKPSEERIENSRETEDKQDEALNNADSDSGRKTDIDKQNTGKRPSLRKRLEEKKAQVSSVPAKPANEKEHVKNNERSITDG